VGRDREQDPECLLESSAAAASPLCPGCIPRKEPQQGDTGAPLLVVYRDGVSRIKTFLMSSSRHSDLPDLPAQHEDILCAAPPSYILSGCVCPQAQAAVISDRSSNDPHVISTRHTMRPRDVGNGP
jgi:hypothetical protein